MSGAREVSAFVRNVVVAASAGTGKTHMLTSLYALLALGLTSLGRGSRREAHPPVPPDRIVATTFSRAAALEIRVRVEAALRSVAEGNASGPLSADIAARLEELSDPPSAPEIAARARAALLAWPRARIDTLHGLAGRIVRDHALALRVAPGLRVGSEDELADAAHAAIEASLGDALEADGDRRDAARALVDACGGIARTCDAVAGLADRLDEEGLDARELGTTDYLAAARALRARLARAVSAGASGARPEIAAAAAAVASALAAEPDDAVALGDAAASAVARLFSIAKPKRGKSPEEEALFEVRASMPGNTNAERAASLIATLEEAAGLERREREMLAWIGDVAARLAAERRARGILGFGDLLRIARAGLRDDPEVAAAVRSEIDALLVDEFQDTSAAQRDIVYLLRERTERAATRPPGAVPGARDIAPHGLFLVGDRKQSIYAFRGADVSVFSAMCAELAGETAGRALEIPEALWGDAPTADFVALRESRRSGRRIVDFVNAFSEADFASHDQPGEAEPRIAYTEAERLIAAPDNSGDEVFVVQDDGADVCDPLAKPEGGALRQAVIAASAAHQLVTGALGPGLSPRDVAILVRRRSTIALVELALGRLGLPYVVAGRALYDTIEVRDLAALLRLVLEPRDRTALAQVLRGPAAALSDGALLALATERGLPGDLLDRTGRSLPAGVGAEDATRLAAFRARFTSVRPALLRLDPERAVAGLVRAFDLDRVIAALPRAAARLGNLDRLARIARERGATLVGFSRWLDRQIADETDEPEAVVFSPEDDAIRLTTIHGAKGLGFEAVVVLDLDAQPKADQPPLGVLRGPAGARFVALHRGRRGLGLDNPARDAARRRAGERAAAERRRITYVALTRAKRVLVLVAPPAPKKGGGSALATLHAHSSGALAGRFSPVAAAELLRAARTISSASPLAETPGPLAVAATPQRLSLATTPLGVFAACPRRFRLRFMLGLDEPVASGQLDLFEVTSSEAAERAAPALRDDGDPRELGRAAHRVLERWPKDRFGSRDSPALRDEIAGRLAIEGLDAVAAAALAPHVAAFVASDFAAGLRSAAVHREADVVFEVRSEGGPALLLRGTVDLWARFDDDRIDLVDYKLAGPRASLEAYAFQLEAYALALARALGPRAIRAGVVFLIGDPAPRWLDGGGPGGALAERDLSRIERGLAETAGTFARARAGDAWPGVEEPVCRRLRCGFITACHRRAEGPAPRPPRGRRPGPR